VCLVIVGSAQPTVTRRDPAQSVDIDAVMPVVSMFGWNPRHRLSAVKSDFSLSQLSGQVGRFEEALRSIG
jgi:hypothetical protein